MHTRSLLFLAGLWLGLFAASAQEPAPPLERILFGSCNKEYKDNPLWKPILSDNPGLWIWLGDIVYGDARNLAELERHYAAQKAKADYKTLRATCPIMGTWDDNDYGWSNGGANNPYKVQCQKLLLDFLDEPPDSPRRKQAGVFASHSFGPPGKRVKVILLDGRYHRTRGDMLGEEQWRWLEQQLGAADAELFIIGSGIQVLASQHRFEKWADIPQSRQRLLDLLHKTKPRNVLLLSGDRHLGEISRLDDKDLGCPLFDITSSGMTHHAESAAKNFWYDFEHEPNALRVGKPCVDLNFGEIEIDWAASPPTLKMEIRDSANAIRAAAATTLR